MALGAAGAAAFMAFFIAIAECKVGDTEAGAVKTYRILNNSNGFHQTQLMSSRKLAYNARLQSRNINLYSRGAFWQQ